MCIHGCARLGHSSGQDFRSIAIVNILAVLHVHIYAFVESEKGMIDMNLQDRNRLTGLKNRLMFALGRIGEGIVREFGMDM